LEKKGGDAGKKILRKTEKPFVFWWGHTKHENEQTLYETRGKRKNKLGGEKRRGHVEGPSFFGSQQFHVGGGPRLKGSLNACVGGGGKTVQGGGE